MTSGIDRLVERARSGLDRLDPQQTAAALAAGDGLLVDIRPAAQRAREGEFADALVIERNVLEWRLDPTCEARVQEATGPNVRWIIACSEGWASSLAAATLQEIGLHRATDLDGGFQAWCRAGLPVRAGIERSAVSRHGPE